MAVKDTSRKPYIQDNDTNVKVGIDLPIRRGNGADGFFATTATTIEAVKNNIRNLLQTNEGERFFQPRLGLNLKRLLFEHITEDNLVSVQDTIFDEYIHSRFLGGGMDLRTANCAQTNVQPELCQIVEAQLPKTNRAEQ